MKLQRSLIIMIFMVVTLLSVIPAAQAVMTTEVVSVHGHSGQIQNPEMVTPYNSGIARVHGLDFVLKNGMTTWVHFSIPARGGDLSWAVRYLEVSFYVGSNDAWVKEIDIYNGNQKLYIAT